MMSTNPILLRLLPAFGVLPFVAGALASALRVPVLPLIGLVQLAVLSYGLMIVSFMAGVHWGQYLSGVRTRVDLLVSSNVVALAAWFGFLFLPNLYFCLLLIVLFVVLNSIDGHLHQQGVIDPQYRQLRSYVTAVVCASLLVVGFA
jgi:Protein of unknown function (DUF3429)